MDVELIDNMFSNSDKQEVQFADAQWLYLQDNNNNQYANYVQFITTTLKNQFIDYHNAYIWMPIRLELPNASATPAGFAPRPPLVAMRESVLSMFSTITVTTDQGQTIVNDVNTSMINNLRLKVENNFDWIHCEGSELDFGYDQFLMQPSQTIATNVGLVANSQQSPAFLAPQGLEPGAINNAPLTNDPNEFGNALLGSFSVTTAAGNVISAINGIAVANGTFIAYVTFPDGRIGEFTYVVAGGVLTSFGGVTLANYTVGPPGATYPYTVTTQALGTAQNNNQPLVSEVITTPITMSILTSGTAPLVFLSIGGVSTAGPTYGTSLAAVNGQAGGRNPNFNKGYLDRVTIFQNSAYYQYYAANSPPPSGNTNTNGTHVYYYVCKVPLKMTHDLSYYFNQTQGLNPNVTYPPFQIGANNAIFTGGLDTTQSPSVFYGVTSGGGSGCRLYYRSLKFQPADTAKMAQLLTTGVTKSIKYMSTDWIIPPNNLISVGNGQTQQQLEQSVVHPLRVWVLSYPNNLNLNPTPATGQGSFIRSNVYASGIIPGSFTQTNLLVNNVPYWRQSFQTTTEQWEQIKEQFGSKGSMLRFIDWLNYQRYQCFDITRIADRLQSPTEPVSLIYIGTRNDNLPYNLENFYLVERENQITFRFSSSDVAVVVGNLD